jgi:hypothetical protein
MRKELKKLLEQWKEGYGIVIDAQKYSAEELNEFDMEIRKSILAQQKSVIQYPRPKRAIR